MKLDCWLVRNAGGDERYYIQLSTAKPWKNGAGWAGSEVFISPLCPTDFEHYTELKLPPGGIMPIRLTVEKRCVGKILWPLKKKARKKK